MKKPLGHREKIMCRAERLLDRANSTLKADFDDAKGWKYLAAGLDLMGKALGDNDGTAWRPRAITSRAR